jgi:acyl carrier protein
MNNLEQYNSVFASVFNVSETALNDDFSSTSVDNWDSITQLGLVTAMEDTFDIMLDPEDILNFKSYALGKEIVGRYGINL